MQFEEIDKQNIKINCWVDGDEVANKMSWGKYMHT
jgi:hypothetical protein